MATKKHFNLAVIGAGPGGYAAAIKAAQMGQQVALIERRYLGGTCLNVGCIPSKTLLAHAEMLQKIKRATEYGIQIGQVSFDYAQMKQRKDKVVSSIQNSLKRLIESNGITIIKGKATFLSPSTLKVRGQEDLILEAKHIIIATGSEPIDIPSFPCDYERIHNSTSILELSQLPQSIAIIGGGYIGCEFASLFAQFGVQVTLIEALPTLVQMQGKAISSALTHAFTKQGIEIRTSCCVDLIEKTKDKLSLHLKGGEMIERDMAVIAVGRKLVSYDLGLNEAGLKTNEQGAIEVNERMETHVPGIYAIGDVTGQAMLAHVATHQGMVAAINSSGQKATVHYHAVPAVIFTHPEIASVGLTLEQAQEAGYTPSVGSFPFQALGKSIATKQTEGFAQIIADKKTKAILGAQIVGHEAGTLISEMALAINNELTLDCVIETIHAHPTLAEAWLEAALLANETPLHLPPKK